MAELSKDKRTLAVEMRVGEAISLDGGRVVVTIEEKSGQRARVRFEMSSDVIVSKVAPKAKPALANV